MFDLTGRLNWIGNKSYNVAIAKTTTPKIGNSIHSKNFFISLEIYGTILHWYCCHVWICAPNCYLDLINNINYYVVCCSCTCSLRQKCPNAELFLVRIFLYSDWIRRFTPNSVRIRKIRTRNNSVFGHFSRSGCFSWDIHLNWLHWLYFLIFMEGLIVISFGSIIFLSSFLNVIKISMSIVFSLYLYTREMFASRMLPIELWSISFKSRVIRDLLSLGFL